MRRQRERETHSWEVWNKNGTDSSAAAALVTKITTPTMNPLTTPLICLPVVSAPESNEGGGRRSVSSSDSGNGSKNRNKKNQTTSSTRSRVKPFVLCAKTIRFFFQRNLDLRYSEKILD